MGDSTCCGINIEHGSLRTYNYVNLDLKLKHTKVLEILQPKQALVDINLASFGVEQVHRVWWHFTWEWHRSHSTR